MEWQVLVLEENDPERHELWVILLDAFMGAKYCRRASSVLNFVEILGRFKGKSPHCHRVNVYKVSSGRSNP
jgi:hypothetical protein